MELYGFIGMIALFAIIIYVSMIMSKSNIGRNDK
jgi:hypothetical protein